MMTPLIHEDPGLQPERTTLAWTRTTVSFAVAAAILLRWLPHYGVLVIALILLMAGIAAGIYFSQSTRHRASVQGLRSGRIRPQVGPIIAMTAGMVVFGVSGIVLIWMT